jgi:hypothetical protein
VHNTTTHENNISRLFILPIPSGSPAPAAGTVRHDQEGAGFDASGGADFSMRNSVSRSPRSMISKRSPVSPTKCGMSIAASGSVQRTSSRSPGARDFKALRVLSTGRGHFSPERSNLVTVMARHVRIVCGPSTFSRLIAGGGRHTLHCPLETAQSRLQ